MTSATQEYVNYCLLPLQTSVSGFAQQIKDLEDQIKMKYSAVTDSVEEMKKKVTEWEGVASELQTSKLARDAELLNLEKRYEEIAVRITDAEKTIFEVAQGSTPPGGEAEDAEHRKARGILGNPAFRNLETYIGDRTKFSKWRSKVRGIFIGEDERFACVFKAMEFLHQDELLPKAEGVKEYQDQVEKISQVTGLDTRTVTRMARQLNSMMISYCEDTALALVEGLEEHGEIAGLEAWRRLFADQKGTLNQRTNALRDKVLHPDRVKLVSGVVQAVTQWEKSYSDLVEACKGNFKLDDHGKIASIKRLLPQEIVSSMVLIHSQLKTYRDARNFIMEQVAEHRNLVQQKGSKQTLDNLTWQKEEPCDDFDPWQSARA